VQLHPYFTERSFAHAPALASIGELAGAHHERLDGAGYHRRSPAAGLGRAARILAAADSYQAMRERRPHRPALTLTAPRPSCCATRATAVCVRRRSMRCSLRPDTAWRNDHASCLQA
jgi:hypothetical protein